MTFEVSIKHVDSGIEVSRITIENLSDDGDEFGDYSVRFAVDRVGGFGISQRGINQFPHTKYNVLALLLQALNTLEPWELELEEGARPPSTRRRLRDFSKGFGRRSAQGDG